MIGSCIFRDGYEFPRDRHATAISVCPSKPPFLQDRSVARHWQVLDATGFPLYKEDAMNAITYSTARAKLADTMDRVCEDHEPIIITRSGQQAVVMISLDDFKALEETSYLLRSPKNAQRLLESIAALESGKGKVRSLAK